MCVYLGREGRGPSQELFAAPHLTHTQPTFCVCLLCGSFGLCCERRAVPCACCRFTQCGSGFNLDGRRVVVTYRRLLCELLWMRMCRREDVGEATGPRSLQFINHELDSLEDVLRRDANAFLAGSEEVRDGVRIVHPPCSAACVSCS